MKLIWTIKYLRFEAQRYMVWVGLNLLILLLVALALHAMMHSNGMWDGIDGKYEAVLIAHSLIYLVLILSSMFVLTFAFLFGRRDKSNANIYLLKLSPRSIYALQSLRFAFFAVSLCIYVLLVLAMSLFIPLPAEARSFYEFLFTASSYMLFTMLLPMLACVFLCVEINNSYARGRRILAIAQALGFCVFWFYLLPMHCLDMLAEMNFLPRIPLALPALAWDVPSFLQSMELALEPLLLAILLTAICVYLTGRVVRETEVF
ncbi:MAG: hypothetical protein OYH77_01770 [Pseudomonadota bacterium]|nr:hypothetical protein [Pseudomonadota bacterium]